MPDAENDDARRGRRLLPVLFWGGVGLTPLAGLLLLVGDGGGFRAGAFLGVLGLVMLGLSIALRPDADTVRLQMEETLLEEVDLLRAELRDGIAASSRATHQTVGERLGALQQVIDSLRAEQQQAYQAPPSAAPAAATGQAAPPPAPPPRATGAAPPPATARAAPHSAAPYSAASYSAPPQQHAPGPPHPVGAVPVGRRPPPPASAPPAGNGRAGARGRPGARHQADDDPRPASTGRAASPPAGVYRHTETVQVTTRSTYVDEPAHNGDRGRGYDGGYGNRDWSGAVSGAVPRGHSSEPYQESWTDQKLRERYSRRPRPYDRVDDAGGDGAWSRDGHWEPVSAEPVSPEPRGGRRRRWEDDPPGDYPSGDYAAGQRWAAVRADDRGRELRVGERHAARHNDERGDELRLEGRWAAVRREDGNGYGRADQGERADHGGRADHGHAEYGRSDHGRSDRGAPEYGRPDYSRRALPAAGSEPSWSDSWNDSWEEPVREPRSHRYRPDFELTDERWR